MVRIPMPIRLPPDQQQQFASFQLQHGGLVVDFVFFQ